RLDDLLRTYTDQHPDVTGTRRIIAMLEKEKKEEIARQRADYESRLQSGTPAVIAAARGPVYQQLKIALADAEAKVAALRARLQDARERYEELASQARMVPEVEAQFAQLNRDYDVQHQNYTQLVARRESANLSSEMEETTTVAEFRIIDPPSVGTEPVAPNRLMILALIAFASLAAGLAVAFLATEIWPTFHSVRKLRVVTRRAVLGAVSAVPNSVIIRRRRRNAFAFSCVFAALLVGYGGAFAALFLDIRLP
ncbi:MAG: GNVR domain-containing protein, partial [Gammaproteobacteria bacterium]